MSTSGSHPAADLANIDPERLEDWKTALQVLKILLKDENGCVSSIALGRELKRKNVKDARGLVVKLRFFDFDAPPDPETPRPDFNYLHRGRCFYSAEAFRKAEEEKEALAEKAGAAAAAEPHVAPVAEEDEEAPRRANRQEEARLVTYVKDALEGIYDSEHVRDDAQFVFDVHNDRAGSDFENVDVLAIHWRSGDQVEVVTVEVKLTFTARLIQQANNYRRFSDRVWIAVPCSSDVAEAANEIRESDPLLFEYTVDLGLGILACRRARGRSYEVFPVQWPRKCGFDPFEREAFVERYRSTFEDAEAIERRAKARFPRLR